VPSVCSWHVARRIILGWLSRCCSSCMLWQLWLQPVVWTKLWHNHGWLWRLQYYCDGEDCRWLISSSREIRLSFTFFSTESGYDYVTINRCTSSSCNSTEQIARLSGLVSSSNVYTSSTGYLQVLFISASASPGLILMDKLYVFVWENHLDPVYMENSITHKMISAIGSSSVSSISSLSTLISRLSDIPAPQFVVITWQEQVSIVLGLTSQEKDSLLAYVNSGGKLVVAYVGSPWSRSLLNCVFGWSLTGIGCSDTQKVSGTATCDFGHTSKKSTKSNTCGSLFTCSGALLFSSTKTAKLQNPCISGHGAFACILYHVSTQEIHRQNLKRHRFSPSVLDNL